MKALSITLIERKLGKGGTISVFTPHILYLSGDIASIKNYLGVDT